MIVMKFGGTSVGSSERIKEVHKIVTDRIEQRPIVVCSAVSGITDMLIKAGTEAVNGKFLFEDIQKKHMEIINDLGLDEDIIAPELKKLQETLDVVFELKQFGKRMYDTMVSFGERMSTRIIAAYFNKVGTKTQQYDAYDIGFVTDDNFDGAEILDETFELVGKNMKDIDHVAIVTGFIGKTKNGEITTLGRGGSDYTASIIGSAVDSKEIQIWTDVNGVMTTDPRIVKNARTVEQLSFAEASELAYFGAKVLHPKTIVPAVKKSIPVRVLNTHEPDHEGSVILDKVENKCDLPVKGIACMGNVNLVNVNSSRMLNAHGFLMKVFEVFAKHEISVDVVATSEVSVSLSVNTYVDALQDVCDELSEFGETKIIRNKALICVVGEGMRSSQGIAGRIFTTMGNNGINIDMISQGASEINVSFIIEENSRESAVKVLHDEFF